MKVLFAGLKYDYGIIERGESLESKTFVPALLKSAEEFSLFWFEENGFPNDINNLQINLVEYADRVKPDVIFFVLMKDEISLQTLEHLSTRYITVNWFCDDTWRFDDFTKFVAPKLRACVTNDKYSITKYKNIGCDTILLSQWATLDYDSNLDFSGVKYEYDISFVGSKSPTREWMVKELKAADLNVHCFGAGWDNGRVSFIQMKEIFYKSKINLNLSNSVPSQLGFFKFIIYNLFRCALNIFGMKFSDYLKELKSYLRYLKFYFIATKTSEQIKARNFEICGWGGFQLSQYALELEDYYSIGNEIAIFTNPEELIKQCKFYLENEEIRKEIGINGHKRTYEHNYNARMASILTKLKR